MAILINGSTGISGVNGTAASPALQGTDADTGIVFGADTASISTAGIDRLLVDASGNLQIASGKLGIGVTPTTDLDLNGNYSSNIVALGSDVFTVDCSQGNYFTQSTSSSNSFSFINVPSSRSFSFALEITHTAGTIGWPTAVKFPGGTAPQLSTSKTHVFVFVTDDGGSRWRGAYLVDYDN
tara:strand:- start:345 stop:890 length:546 start_codon:yes stop_codon:yes gene_type:complete